MIVAVTGHRPPKLGGYQRDATERLFNFALDTLQLEKPGTTVISGMALGWDTAIALAALQLKMPLVCALPFPGQDRMWPITDQRQYRDILSRAETVHMVNYAPYAAWKLHARNEWMVNNCEKLIALFDNSPGGTWSCVKYAEKRFTKQGMPQIVNMWDRWQEICK